MAYTATIVQVMIASPGDVNVERQIIRDVIHDWNDVNASYSGVMLTPIGWDTHSAPELGKRPQELINTRILEDCDLLIGVFWTRIGTPTGGSISGTVEEIKEHMAKGKPAMVYFCDKPATPMTLDTDQYEKLKTFRKECQGLGLIESFDHPDEFRRKLAKQLQIEFRKNEYLKNVIQPAVDRMNAGAKGFKDPSPQEPPVRKLVAEAKHLLRLAGRQGDGIIYNLSFIGGRSIQAGDESFGGEPRLAARYSAALDELVNAGLVVDRNGKGEYYEFTNAGWEAADLIH